MVMENTPELITERLILRKFTSDDIKAFFDIMSDETVNKFLPWFPVKSLEEAEKMLAENYLKEYEKPSGYKYAICIKGENIPIGYCGMSSGESNDVGYGLKQEFWRQGIVTEAMEAMVKRIKLAGCPYITATHDVNNPSSGQVMKRLGMVYKYSYEELWQPKSFLVTFRMYQLNFDGKNTADDYTYMEYWNRYENHFVEKHI